MLTEVYRRDSVGRLWRKIKKNDSTRHARSRFLGSTQSCALYRYQRISRYYKWQYTRGSSPS